MKYNFDEIINRENTGSVKYTRKLFNKPTDVLPMWVADMDFAILPEAAAALKNCAQRQIFGYSELPDNYKGVTCAWLKKRFGWGVLEDWIIPSPGVIFSFATAIQALTKEGEAVIICQPVYHPFANIINANKRRLIVNELKLVNSRYEMDFEAFEKQIKENNVKAFLFCSPHNPVGRVWTREELVRLTDICLRHKVFIISDEIHCDLVFAPHKHIPTAYLSEAVADITVTCTSPTKTFNIAGLQCANAFAKNPAIRNMILAVYAKTGTNHLNIFGAAAAVAAYRYGEEWLEQLLLYLKGNFDLLKEKLKDTPIKLIPLEGTYLAWLDCRDIGLQDKELEAFFLEEAGLWLNNGAMFGLGGSGFMRINIAAPRATIKTATDKLKKALLDK